jgi:hypothetical protein
MNSLNRGQRIAAADAAWDSALEAETRARDISIEGWECYERAKLAYEAARDKLHAASIACSDARFKGL